MKKELYFGLAIMAMILIGVAIAMPAPSEITDGHLGLLMLSLVVVAIMLGFPTAFTLMGMGVIFTYFAYDGNIQQTLDLMVQSTYKVMTNDVLISVPLFVFMGYLVERANLIEKLFKSLHLAMARLPGALGVATLVTCAIFATATGIVGAVSRLRHPNGCRCNYSGWLLGYFDSTFCAADCVRCHRGCFRGSALRGCVFPRFDADWHVHCLHHDPCKNQSEVRPTLV